MYQNIIPPECSIDISDHAVRVAVVRLSGGKQRLVAHANKQLPPGSVLGGEIQDKKAVAKVIGEALNSCVGRKINGITAAVAIPEHKTFIKLIDIPETGQVVTQDQVAAMLPSHIPYETNEVYFDWHIVRHTEAETIISLVAAPKTTVDAYVAVLDQIGVITVSIEPETVAVARALTKASDTQPTIIIDCGAAHSSIIFCFNQTIETTLQLPLTGDTITDSIASKLKITSDEAEKIKRDCITTCPADIKKIITNFLDLVTTTIQSLITLDAAQHPERSQPKIILTGGSSQLAGLAEYLTEKIALPVEHGNPLLPLTHKKNVYVSPTECASLTTAIGLALT